jgi:murein L,D-transpeptidase YcbB/YkuD
LILVLVSLVAILSMAAADSQQRSDPVASELRAQTAHLPRGDRYIADVYQARDFRPLWSHDGRPDAQAVNMLIGRLSQARDDGLVPERYAAPALRLALERARSGRAGDLARLDLWLSRVLAAYESDLRSPGPGASAVITDPALAPPGPADVLRAAGAAPSIVRHLNDARRMHPIYEALRAEYVRVRSAPPSADARAYQRSLLANMDRVRMLPSDPSARYILVDAVAARLWLYENGRPVDSMKVVVGKTSQPTPILSGLIRYAAVDPYWNMPPDLVRDQLAPKVLRRGAGVLDQERLEVLSDWSPAAAPVPAGAVNWAAVAAGDMNLRVRQRPGQGNMMGRVKFMFPNRLGVYLHDTSDHSVFGRAQRRLSAGCVRVEDAARLSRWLGVTLPQIRYPTEHRVDLPAPTPVYITYLTVLAGSHGVERGPDPYGRDDPSTPRGSVLVAGAGPSVADART